MWFIVGAKFSYVDVIGFDASAVWGDYGFEFNALYLQNKEIVSALVLLPARNL